MAKNEQRSAEAKGLRGSTLDVRPPAQRPGCLPIGFDENSVLTIDEFCRWQRCRREDFTARRRRLPGVLYRSRENVRIHVGTYLAGVRQGKG